MYPVVRSRVAVPRAFDQVPAPAARKATPTTRSGTQCRGYTPAEGDLLRDDAEHRTQDGDPHAEPLHVDLRQQPPESGTGDVTLCEEAARRGIENPGAIGDRVPARDKHDSRRIREFRKLARHLEAVDIG